MKIIKIGSPESDAQYLVCGFSGGQGARRCLGQIARMTLLLPEGEPNALTLDLWYDRPQIAHILLNEHELGILDVKGTADTETFTLDIPANLATPNSLLEVYCEYPHPLDAHQPRCLELSAVTLRKWSEPASTEAKEDLPGNLYFGDIHVHSNLSPCRPGISGSLADNYQWAREDGWDFTAITDHDTFLSDKQWEESVTACDTFNDPGHFATLFAYEWTSFFYGQMNVYSPSPQLQLLRCTDHSYNSPPKLWRALKDTGLPAFTVYHHMAAAGWATTWDYNDPAMLPLLEIYSIWRSSENAEGCTFQGNRKLAGSTVGDALARGLRVGLIGGGDAHHLRPGTRGIAGVYAQECTREAIWESLKAKRCYATTGARIGLDFSINGIGMGNEIVFTPYTQDLVFPAKASIKVVGTAPIRRVELIGNGETIYGQEESFGLSEVCVDVVIENLVRKCNASALSNPSRWYYVRVEQEDGHVAWSSPIYLVRDWSGIE